MQERNLKFIFNYTEGNIYLSIKRFIEEDTKSNNLHMIFS